MDTLEDIARRALERDREREAKVRPRRPLFIGPFAPDLGRYLYTDPDEETGAAGPRRGGDR